MAPDRRPPPAWLIAAAERDHHAARDELTGLIIAVRTLLANGFSELEVVTDTWLTLRAEQHKPFVMLVSAVAVVQLAASPLPIPALQPSEQPPTETR